MSIDLTESWLREQGVPQPDAVVRAWKAWLANPGRKRKHESGTRKALELASGLTRAAIDHYIHGRRGKLSAGTVRRLDELCMALGEPLPEGRLKPHDTVVLRRRSVRVAVLVDLRNPPSPRFHLEGLDNVIEACEHNNFSVSLHQVSQGAVANRQTLARILRSARPDALVWFRLTPAADALDSLRRLAPGLPAIVLYGARLLYESPPVLLHVFPSQERIREDIADWAARLRSTIGDGYVVVAHLRREVETHDLPSSRFPPSVRNERIDGIAAGIGDAGLRAELREVPDYAASRALKLVNEAEDAVGFICLADELCLGVLHQLEARGVPTPARRLLGFDDSAHSREFGICSFTQHLPLVGSHVAEALSTFLERQSRSDWPPFREEPVPVELVLR